MTSLTDKRKKKKNSLALLCCAVFAHTFLSSAWGC